MSFRTKVKKVTPKVDLQSYSVLVAGTFKTGKTRSWKEILEYHYPNEPEAGLLLAFEPGYKTWELESVIPMHEYDWKFFRTEVVKGLIAEAKTGRVTKVIGVDTVDRCIDMCSDYILEECSKKYGQKFTTLQDIAQKTNDNGYILLKDELRRQFDALKNAGYGFFWLAWTKEKETELIDGMKYTSLELNMSKTGKDIFESQADLICCLFNEVKVLDKEGNVLKENVKDKKGKDKASNFHTTETMMYFRPSNYIGIAGGRFTDLPEKVPYSAANFMEVFENAVKAQLKNPDQVEELREREGKEREEKATEYATVTEEVTKEEEAIVKVEDLIQQLSAKIDPLSTPEKTELAKKFKAETGVANYKTVKDADILKKFIEIIG